jgi:hypothetical protein
MWLHPKIGEFTPIPAARQPLKVWKHLYATTEAWTAIVGVDTSRLHHEARSHGCPELLARGGPREPSFSPECTAHLRADHDTHWVDAYKAEIFDPRTLVGPKHRGRRWVMATPRGVYVVVEPGSPSYVCTVYRPHPPGTDVPPSEPLFVRNAANRWRRETNMRLGELKEWLRAPATTAGEVWLLAHAIAIAKAEGGEDVSNALAEAESRLAVAPRSLRMQAIPVPDRLLERLEAALKDDDDDEAASVVLDLEDAIGVTAVLSGDHAASDLMERLSNLVDWAPPGWADLVTLVDDRRGAVRGVTARWWDILADRLDAIALEDLPARQVVPATIAPTLFAPPWWRRFADGLARLGESVWRALEPSAAGLRVGPVGLGTAAEKWEVCALENLPCGPDTRVFVVDAEHPSGEEVTADIGASGSIWMLEAPGQEAILVVVRGLTGSDLAEVIARATEGGPGTIEVIRVSRPR